MVDGAFYRKRAYNLFGDKKPAERTKELSSYCHRHIKAEKVGATLHRVFYYDCPPVCKQVYHPFKELKHQRKFALRLGRVAEEQALFNIKPESFRKVINGTIKLEDLTEKDFALFLLIRRKYSQLNDRKLKGLL